MAWCAQRAKGDAELPDGRVTALGLRPARTGEEMGGRGARRLGRRASGASATEVVVWHQDPLLEPAAATLGVPRTRLRSPKSRRDISCQHTWTAGHPGHEFCALERA
jgi:hypothetical protein